MSGAERGKVRGGFGQHRDLGTVAGSLYETQVAADLRGGGHRGARGVARTGFVGCRYRDWYCQPYRVLAVVF